MDRLEPVRGGYGGIVGGECEIWGLQPAYSRASLLALAKSIYYYYLKQRLPKLCMRFVHLVSLIKWYVTYTKESLQRNENNYLRTAALIS